MGKFDGLLICSDMDGTLFWKRQISEENREAIRYFRENGGAFTVASGRDPNWLLRNIGREFFHSPVICVNGGVIYDPAEDKILFRGIMPNGYQETVREAMHWDGMKEVHFFPATLSDKRCLTAEDSEEASVLLSRELIKVVFCVTDEATDVIKKRLRERLDERFLVARSWSTGIEIFGESYSKGYACRRVARLIGADTLICMGDYENDLSMICEADIGVAMGNALPSVKEAATVVTATAEEHGVAKFIYSL